MAQAPTFIGLWDTNRPQGTESRTESDDYHRNIAESVKMSIPNVTGQVTSTHQDLNTVSGLAAAGTKPLPGVGGQTVIYFYLATPPAGYTPVNPDANVRTLMVGGTGGTIAGSEDPSAQPVNTVVTVSLSGTTGGHALTEAENGPHDHRYTDATIGPGSPASGIGGENVRVEATVNGGTTVSSGSGAPHTHPLSGNQTGTGAGTLSPRYAMGVLGQLDA